jgi:hypothetical protein
MQTKWCPGCQADRPIEVFYAMKTTADGLSNHCAYHNRLHSTHSLEKRRLAFLTAMGGKCIQCGFSDWRALQVDHVHGGGSAERKALKSNSKAFYAKVLANPEAYQLLCANCNWIKKYENKESGRAPGLRVVPAVRLDGPNREPGKPSPGAWVGRRLSGDAKEKIAASKVGRKRVYQEDGSYTFERPMGGLIK